MMIIEKIPKPIIFIVFKFFTVVGGGDLGSERGLGGGLGKERGLGGGGLGIALVIISSIFNTETQVETAQIAATLFKPIFSHKRRTKRINKASSMDKSGVFNNAAGMPSFIALIRTNISRLYLFSHVSRSKASQRFGSLMSFTPYF